MLQKIGAAVGVAALLGLGVYMFGTYKVDQGETAILLRFGKVVAESGPGLHLKIPIIESARYFSEREQVTRIDAMEAYSFDQQPAMMAVSVNWAILPGAATELYERYGSLDALNQQEILRKTPTFLKIAFGKYTAVTAIHDRGPLLAAVSKAILESLANVADVVTIKSVQVEDIAYSDAYEQQVEQAAQAQVQVQQREQELRQEQVKAQTVVVQAEAAARVAIAQANGAAEAVRVAAEANAFKIKAEGDATAAAILARTNALATNAAALAAQTLAEAWDGKLPTVMPPGGTVPFLNVAPLTAAAAGVN